MPQKLESSTITNEEKLEKLDNIHPGEILKEEFLIPLNISSYQLAKSIGVEQSRISQIINKKRSITPDTAVRLSRFFGTSAKFWLNLQNAYDLEEISRNNADKFDFIKPISMELPKIPTKFQ